MVDSKEVKYSRVHISSEQSMKSFFHWKKKNQKKNLKKKNLKWPTKKKLIFQLRQFSIFFLENFMG